MTIPVVTSLRWMFVAAAMSTLLAFAAEPVALTPAAVAPRSDALQARPELSEYRGWLKYLRFRAENAIARKGAASDDAKQALARWDDWVGRISADPQARSKLRGVQEWAYESRADGSGQPFKIVIPDDYDANRPAPLSLYLHGATGNHLDHSAGFHAHNGSFDLAVLGRSRIGGYVDLSEADVLDVLAYVKGHWAIDGRRVQLTGGSMGGMGTYRLGARYPQLWACGVVTCGAGDSVPMANLLTMPLYVIHSVDDPLVPEVLSRGPADALRALGGQVIRDETTGLGHASWNFGEGQARAGAWAPLQVGAESSAVRKVDFTAMDGIATRGWWIEAVEWDDTTQPARLNATVGAGNTVYLSLEHLRVAVLHLDESPINRDRPLKLSVNAGVAIEVAAPLPAQLFVRRDGDRWQTAATGPDLPFRLHAPGGPSLLYSGEPLLIVYGTSGDAATKAALLAAAHAAAQSPGPVWQDIYPNKDSVDADGIPQLNNLYGELPMKADTDVTAEDIARCHLVLIGTATQNSVVARLAPKLPASLAAEGVTCSDGVRFAGEHLGLGLVYYNPLAPRNLVFWVAANDLSFYAPASIIPATLAGRSHLTSEEHFGADLLVSRGGDQPQDIVATRSFGSRWQWARRREDSPLLREAWKTYAGAAQEVAAVARRHADTELGLSVILDAPNRMSLWDAPPRPTAADAFAIGTARIVDVQALYWWNRIAVFEMSGARLADGLKKAGASRTPFALAGIAPDQLEPSHVYTVAIPTESLWWWNSRTLCVPEHYRQTERFVADALERE